MTVGRPGTMAIDDEDSWREIMGPIIRKLRLPSNFPDSMDTVYFTATAAAALANLIEEMATLIDDETTARKRRKK